MPIIALAPIAAALLLQQPAASTPSLDYEFFSIRENQAQLMSWIP
jgi:hypothetical protein